MKAPHSKYVTRGDFYINQMHSFFISVRYILCATGHILILCMRFFDVNLSMVDSMSMTDNKLLVINLISIGMEIYDESLDRLFPLCRYGD